MKNNYLPSNVEDITLYNLYSIKYKKLSGIFRLGIHDENGAILRYFINGEQIDCSSPEEFSKLLKMKVFL